MVPARFVWDRFTTGGVYVDTVESSTFDFPYDGEAGGYRYKMTRGSPDMLTWGIYDAVPIYGYKEVNKGKGNLSIVSYSGYTYGSGYTFDKVKGEYTITNGTGVTGKTSFKAVSMGTVGSTTLSGDSDGQGGYVEDTIQIAWNYSTDGGKFSLVGATTYSTSQITTNTRGYIVNTNPVSGVTHLGEITSVAIGVSAATLNYKWYEIGSVFSGKYFILNSDKTKLYYNYTMSSTYAGSVATIRDVAQSTEIVGYRKGNTKYGTTLSPDPTKYPHSGRNSTDGRWYALENATPYQFDDRYMGV